MQAEYKTVKSSAQAEFIEKKSRFIGSIAPCKSEAEALEFISEIRKQNHDANHNVYAYIISANANDTAVTRSSDDGEPQGTAGHPVLSVLEKEGITDVCVVVTRYFGGILLGAGGLTRAYSHGSKLALDAGKVKVMSMCSQILLTCDYNLYGKVSYILPNYNVVILNSDFGADVKLSVLIRNDRTSKFTADLTEITNGQVNIDIILEEYAEMQ